MHNLTWSHVCFKISILALFDAKGDVLLTWEFISIWIGSYDGGLFAFAGRTMSVLWWTEPHDHMIINVWLHMYFNITLLNIYSEILCPQSIVLSRTFINLPFCYGNKTPMCFCIQQHIKYHKVQVAETRASASCYVKLADNVCVVSRKHVASQSTCPSKHSSEMSHDIEQ